MPFRLRRDDAHFGELFAGLAAQLVASANLLAEMLGQQGAELRGELASVRAAEQNADVALNAVLRGLSSAFVTPFDRVDVYRVAWAMRGCITRICAAAEDVVDFELDELPPVVTDLVQLLATAGEVAVAAVPRLQKPALLTDSSLELDRLGRQARAAQRRFVVEASGHAAEPSVLVRRVAVAQSLRRAVESFEELAHAFQTVAVKEG